MPNVSIDAMKIMSDDARYFIVWVNKLSIGENCDLKSCALYSARLTIKIELPPLRESEGAQSLEYRVLRIAAENLRVLLETECYRECVLYTYRLSILLTRDPLRHCANHALCLLIK